MLPNDTHGKAATGIVVVMHCQANLLKLIDAVRSTSRLASRLDRRQQHHDQDRDDGDHNEQFHEGKTGGPWGVDSWPKSEGRSPMAAGVTTS